MKIYWANREKNNAPPEAQFFCHPFSSQDSTDFKGPFERIETLPAPRSFQIKRKYDLPSYEQWIEMTEKALLQKTEKVVLAKCQILELLEPPDPFAIAAALELTSQGAFIFCLQKADTAFVGASPERLFARQGNQLLTEAMAGTRHRGKTKEEDRELQKELLSSEKDLREITPIQTFLKERLSPLCTEAPLFSNVAIHQTHTVQHLYSQIKAELKEPISDEAILRAIHPTPALCGAPQQEAFDLIRKLEPFERGLYGGVIGWRTKTSSEWAVAIRSCLIQGSTVRLFSGAGIVKGSNGAAEWDELNHKLKTFDEVFVNRALA